MPDTAPTTATADAPATRAHTVDEKLRVARRLARAVKRMLNDDTPAHRDDTQEALRNWRNVDGQ